MGTRTINAALPVIVRHPNFSTWMRKHNPPTTFSASWTRKALEDLGIPWEGGIFKNLKDDDPTLGTIQLKTAIDLFSKEEPVATNGHAPPEPEPIVSITPETYEAIKDGPIKLPVASTLHIYEELKMSLIELGGNHVLYREGLSDDEVAKRTSTNPDWVVAVREEAFGVLAVARDPHSHFMMGRLSELEGRIGKLEDLLAKAARKVG